MNDGLFGKVTSPAPIGGNPSADLGNLIAVMIVLVFTIGGIVAMVYMLWGAVNWITSGGDKEKLMKAQARIRNAIIGIFVLIVVFAAFVTIFQVILGGTIIKYENGAIQFTLPQLGPNTPPECPLNPAPGSGGC